MQVKIIELPLDLHNHLCKLKTKTKVCHDTKKKPTMAQNRKEMSQQPHPQTQNFKK
jgi:hypothetical protein